MGQTLTGWVRPLTGTDRMGHTYPGATVPFGMVQLSPETDTLPYEVDGHYNKDVYKYCGGYQYQDNTIVGFAHTHFSGTGHSDLGDFLIMPTTGTLQMHPGTAAQPESGYRSGFSHKNEVATPDYYSVLLDKYGIRAELTTTTRVGVHRYTFPAAKEARIVFDAVYGIYNYADKNVWTYLRVENDSTVTGYRQTNGWGRTRVQYFAMVFSRPIKDWGWLNESKKEVYRGFWRKFDQEHHFTEAAGTALRGHFEFGPMQAGDTLIVRLALSPVSTANALENLRKEAPMPAFDAIHKAGVEQWEAELGKTVITADTETMQNFYTALYHAYINPTIYTDVNGTYMGLDRNVHTASGFTNYTTFSLWDTYRALHPLLNLLQPDRNSDMVHSMIAHYEQSAQHMLPVWSNSANENWCMIGYHSVPVIADAILKGNYKGDAVAALNACVATANHNAYDGIGYYRSMGYVPEDKSGASVSKTLEYAYDDWCIAALARKLGRQDIADTFARRAGYYRNVYDAGTGYMRPRLSNGSFKKDFDVLNTDEAGYIEGNAWNYSLYVPHEPDSMIALMGGAKRFARHLDSLFTMQLPDSFFAHTEDITRDGIIGNYVHGNEPSHHVAYLYNHAGMPWRTQERVRMILQRMYHPAPAGLSGNDDCGQMSAWYIFSALGFYPMAPGSDYYETGSPAITSALIQLPNGKDLHITANNQSARNVYVRKITLNGKAITNNRLSYAELMKGGDLVYEMSSMAKK